MSQRRGRALYLCMRRLLLVLVALSGPAHLALARACVSPVVSAVPPDAYVAPAPGELEAALASDVVVCVAADTESGCAA